MAGLEKIVSDALVFETADRLAAEGRKVSNRMVWDQIGGGSMTTIAAALRRWRERQQLKAEQAPERTPLPEAIAAAMHEAVERLWRAAQEETQREIDRLTQAMNGRVAEAHAEREAALAELQTTVEELDALKTRAGALEADLQGARGEAASLRERLTEASRAAEISATKAAENARRADDLGAELARVHAEAKAERQRHGAALSGVNAQLEATRGELAKAQSALQTQGQRATDLERELTRSQERLGQAETEREAARRETAAARESAARQQGQLEAMTTQHAELLRVLGSGNASKEARKDG